MACIVAIGKAVLGRRYVLHDECVVGRSPECHICIVDDEVSRRHALLKAAGDVWSVADLGSRNGVLVNGERIGGERVLKANDCLSMGPYLLLFDPEFEVLPDSEGSGAAVVAPDSQTLTSHPPLVRAAPVAAWGFDVELMAALGTHAGSEDALATLSDLLRTRHACESIAILQLRGEQLETVCVTPKQARVSIPKGVLESCRAGNAVAVGGGVASPRIISAQAIRTTQTTLTIPLSLGGDTLGFAHFAKPEGRTWDEGGTEELMRCSPVLALAVRFARALEAHTHRERRSGFTRPLGGGQDILGASKAIREILTLIARAAAAPSPILITGETGTGKELIARAVHRARFAEDAPFVPINCGAVPEHLLESEFFGYERGAFSGSTQRKLGLFEVASGGTLFLDELGELPMNLQVKLLRALEQRQFYRLGGVKPVAVDFRLVAATNRDLAQMVKEGTFRGDLMYRVDVLRISAPPLRDRPEDITLLFERFLRETCDEMHKPCPGLTRDGERALHGYAWPGNVRELRNVAERVAVFAVDQQVSAETVRSVLLVAASEAPSGDLPLSTQVARLETTRIEAALARTHYNKAAAARLLGISRPTLDKKIRDYGLGSHGEGA